MAIDYTEQLLETCNSIRADIKTLQDQLSGCDRLQSDLLHIIENENFNAAQGYKLAKMLQDNRGTRRRIKNELETLIMLRNSIVDTNLNKLKLIQKRIDKKNEILAELSECKIYNPKVLETTNLKEVTSL